METKCTYTKEEVDELAGWFEANRSKLPSTMQIDACAYTPDLPNTVDMLLKQAYICHENPKMQGCIRLLQKIKQKIEQD